MATSTETAVRVTRWRGAKHPTLSNLTKIMQKEGLRPYKWDTQPNQRFGVRSHGYKKVLYVVDGTMEISLPDSNQRMKLRAGDRVEIPSRIRHGSISGQNGATCLEASIRDR